MSYMTKLDGVPDRDDVRPGMAHFEGSGPEGKTCGKCKHKGYYRQSTKPKIDKVTGGQIWRTYKTGSCAMFKKLTGLHGPVINRRWAACKYFEERKQ